MLIEVFALVLIRAPPAYSEHKISKVGTGPPMKRFSDSGVKEKYLHYVTSKTLRVRRLLGLNVLGHLVPYPLLMTHGINDY